MTRDEAQAFLTRGHAQLGPSGWYIAHEIAGELEWFLVRDEDAAHFDALTDTALGA